MKHSLYELDVRLCDIEPPVWRTIEIPGEASLDTVHYAIQMAMGWENCHLHQFTIAGSSYGMLAPGGDPPDMLDERSYRLMDLVAEGDQFTYDYDFGDDWRHAIKVSRVTAAGRPPRTRCTAGARACPPEDCGGPHGYAVLLDALANPKHKRHKELSEWIGEVHPERFKLPRDGRDLSDDIEELRELATSDDPADLALNIPQALVEAALSLPPMERAALGALIAGSLADEGSRRIRTEAPAPSLRFPSGTG